MRIERRWAYLLGGMSLGFAALFFAFAEDATITAVFAGLSAMFMALAEPGKKGCKENAS